MIILCLGMPGSASTLAFNLAREIAAEATGLPVTGLEATTLAALEAVLAGPPPPVLVIRAHTASHALLGLLAAAGARVLPTTRDARDCVASLHARLGHPASAWCTEVARSLAAVSTVLARGGGEAIRYETAGQDPGELAAAVSARLGLALAPSDLARIAARWSRAAVAGRLRDLAGTAPSIYGWRSDAGTGLNEAHLGDGRIGKWRDALAPGEAALVDAAFGDLGDAALPARPGRRIRFAEPLFGTAARPAASGNLPAASSIGLRLLCLCYLGVGRWRVTLRGSLPASHAPGRLSLAVGGRVQGAWDIPAAAPGKQAVPLPPGLSAGFDHRDHEHQVELVLAGPATALPDPFRADPLVLEAELEAP